MPEYQSSHTGEKIDEAIDTILYGNLVETCTQGAKTATEQATKSQSYAVGGTGTRPGEDTDNAKYWAGKAAEIGKPGDMTQAVYDPQKKETDIFKYIEEHGGGGYTAQPEPPADIKKLWIDTDDATTDQIVTSVNGQTGDVDLTAADVGAIPAGEKGAASGVATLDAGGHLPEAQNTKPITAKMENAPGWGDSYFNGIHVDKYPNGLISISGGVSKSGNQLVSGRQKIGTLPVGFRPIRSVVLTATDNYYGGAARVTIEISDSTGEVYASPGRDTQYSTPVLNHVLKGAD